MQAREIMTPTPVTCTPETSAAKAAQLMRDRNMGDVLVTDGGELVGIVTDRDIAVRMSAASHDPHRVPISDLMTKRVITGQPNWDVDMLARTMARHQVRRLPIVENGRLVGIVSLGDLARKNARRLSVSDSLREISEPSAGHMLRTGARRVTSIGVPLLVGTAIAATVATRAGSALIQRLQETRT